MYSVRWNKTWTETALNKYFLLRLQTYACVISPSLVEKWSCEKNISPCGLSGNTHSTIQGLNTVVCWESTHCGSVWCVVWNTAWEKPQVLQQRCEDCDRPLKMTTGYMLSCLTLSVLYFIIGILHSWVCESSTKLSYSLQPPNASMLNKHKAFCCCYDLLAHGSEL